MDLPRITDLAARQAIDSARTFKEYARVRRDLKKLGGSMFWKPVDKYEYLVQRSGTKVNHLGRRSPETERQYEDFLSMRDKLQARLKSLEDTVKAAQRLNRAVRAGSAPTELIEMLSKLEDLGMSDRAVVLGTPALYAYGQPSGIRFEDVKAPHQTCSVVADAGKRVHIVFEAPEAVPWRSVYLRLKEALKRLAVVEPVAVASKGSTIALEVNFKAAEKPSKHFLSHVKATKTLSKLEPSWTSVLKSVPKFEQVVIGKSGKMALMRTLDPQVFAALGHHNGEQVEEIKRLLETTKVQADLVVRMLKEHMVVSKVDPTRGDMLARQLASPNTPAIKSTP